MKWITIKSSEDLPQVNDVYLCELQINGCQPYRKLLENFCGSWVINDELDENAVVIRWLNESEQPTEKIFHIDTFRPTFAGITNGMISLAKAVEILNETVAEKTSNS